MKMKLSKEPATADRITFAAVEAERRARLLIAALICLALAAVLAGLFWTVLGPVASVILALAGVLVGVALNALSRFLR